MLFLGRGGKSFFVYVLTTRLLKPPKKMGGISFLFFGIFFFLVCLGHEIYFAECNFPVDSWVGVTRATTEVYVVPFFG